MEFTEVGKKRWKEGLIINIDAYSAAVYQYAERWANLMEEGLKKEGVLVADIAEKTSREADTEGITGFMYGAAVATLSSVWVHGEQLRRWHNLDTQVQDEGEKANKKEGAVLDPAILTIDV